MIVLGADAGGYNGPVVYFGSSLPSKGQFYDCDALYRQANAGMIGCGLVTYGPNNVNSSYGVSYFSQSYQNEFQKTATGVYSYYERLKFFQDSTNVTASSSVTVLSKYELSSDSSNNIKIRVDNGQIIRVKFAAKVRMLNPGNLTAFTLGVGMAFGNPGGYVIREGSNPYSGRFLESEYLEVVYNDQIDFTGTSYTNACDIGPMYKVNLSYTPTTSFELHSFAFTIEALN
jgi:hypothetical protein